MKKMALHGPVAAGGVRASHQASWRVRACARGYGRRAQSPHTVLPPHTALCTSAVLTLPLPLSLLPLSFLLSPLPPVSLSLPLPFAAFDFAPSGLGDTQICWAVGWEEIAAAIVEARSAGGSVGARFWTKAV